MGRKIRRIDGSKCGLVSQNDILEAQRDPEVVNAQKRLIRINRKSRQRLNRRERAGRTLTVAGLQSRIN